MKRFEESWSVTGLPVESEYSSIPLTLPGKKMFGMEKTKMVEYVGNDFMVFDVVGDGNCLFRAVSLAVWGSEEEYMFVRWKAGSWMEDHGNALDEKCLRGALMELTGMVECTIERDIVVALLSSIMQKDGRWGGYESLVAISGAYDVSVVVLDVGSGNALRVNAEDGKLYGKEIYLRYVNGNHYQLAIPKKKWGNVVEEDVPVGLEVEKEEETAIVKECAKVDGAKSRGYPEMENNMKEEKGRYLKPKKCARTWKIDEKKVRKMVFLHDFSGKDGVDGQQMKKEKDMVDVHAETETSTTDEKKCKNLEEKACQKKRTKKRVEEDELDAIVENVESAGLVGMERPGGRKRGKSSVANLSLKHMKGAGQHERLNAYYQGSSSQKKRQVSAI